MKAVLTLFYSLVLAGVPLMTVAEETSAEREAYTKSLFEGRCQMCHQLPEPGMLKPKQWKLILTTMQQRMQQAGVPPLTEDETEAILEYIAEQSR
jgi:mono/diheme cytochrome c family protein